MTATSPQFRCDVSRWQSDCDATLAAKLRASLHLQRKPATRIQPQTRSSRRQSKA